MKISTTRKYSTSTVYGLLLVFLLTLSYTPVSNAQDTLSGYFDFSLQVNSSSPYSIYAPVLHTLIGTELPLEYFYFYISADVKLDFTGATADFFSQTFLSIHSLASSISLHEAYITYTGTGIKITAGNKISILGSGYGINPTNFINPCIVEKQLISTKTTDWYIPIPLVGINILLDTVSINGYVMPFFIPNSLPALNTKWTPSQLLIFTNLLAFSLQATEKPDISFANFQYGLTASFDFSNITLTLSGFYGFTKNPVYEIIPSAPPMIVTPTHKRYWMIGIDFSAIIFDDYTVWLESAVTLPDYVAVVNAGIPGYSENTSIFSIAGIDRTFVVDTSDLYLNIQFTHKFIADYTDNIVENEHIFGTLLVAEYRMNNMMYIVKTSIYFPDMLDFSTNKTFVIKPSFLYKPIDNLSIELGYILIEGSSDSLIGQYSQNDSFLLQILYNY